MVSRICLLDSESYGKHFILLDSRNRTTVAFLYYGADLGLVCIRHISWEGKDNSVAILSYKITMQSTKTISNFLVAKLKQYEFSFTNLFYLADYI